MGYRPHSSSDPTGAFRSSQNRFPRGEAVERSETDEECGRRSGLQVTWQAYSKVVPLEEVWKVVQIFSLPPEFLIRLQNCPFRSILNPPSPRGKGFGAERNAWCRSGRFLVESGYRPSSSSGPSAHLPPGGRECALRARFGAVKIASPGGKLPQCAHWG